MCTYKQLTVENCHWNLHHAQTEIIMDLNSHRTEIEQFLFDLRDHLKQSIEEPTEYENTVNLFGDSSVYQNRKFLERCEKILSHFSDSSNNNLKVMQNGFSTPEKSTNKSTRSSILENIQSEEISYLEMSATPPKKAISTEYIDFQEQKTSETPTKSNEPDNEDDEDDEDDGDNEENKILDKGIYDICNESPQSDDSLKTNLETENNTIPDCPYAGLPASHLSIQKSTKFGQLQRVEKRLFFDQCKKCYCGILSDWLLCYCDGIASLRPAFSVHLKTLGVEVEHYGDGKRRELCFQITTPDPNKKYVFQCNSEVEAKEWIHAIEAVIRGDSGAHLSATKSPRKLPTPPLKKKPSIADNVSNRSESMNDCIYEEPSPLYNMHQPTELLIEKNKNDNETVPDVPEKQKSITNMAKKFDYDIPKSPPLPINSESETAELLDISRNNSDFQMKIKDVHSKLSSQLSTSGPSPERLKRIVKKTLSSDSDTSTISSQQTPTKEQKKTVKNSLKNSKSPSQEKSSRNWFLNRLNKSTSSTRSSTSSPTKCKQSEKENLLNNLEMCDGYEGELISPTNGTSSAVNVKGSKVNMIINQFEASGHIAMFSVDAFNGGHSDAKLSSFLESDCNNYEPIMTGPSSFMKKM